MTSHRFVLTSLLILLGLSTSEECVDDWDAYDTYGDGCDWYYEYPESCGEYDWDEFVAVEACCACEPGDDDYDYVVGFLVANGFDAWAFFFLSEEQSAIITSDSDVCELIPDWDSEGEATLSEIPGYDCNHAGKISIWSEEGVEAGGVHWDYVGFEEFANVADFMHICEGLG